MEFKTENEIGKEFRLESPINIKELLIEGKFETWNGDFYEVLSPIRIKENDGKLKKVICGSFPLADKKIALRLLDETSKAYDNGWGHWPKMSVEERIEYLNKFINELMKYREEIIKTLMWEIAKNLKDATTEFDRTILYIEDTISKLKELEREAFPKSIGGLIVENKPSPLGVVFVMGPYNYPLNETFANIIPALLMGNTVLVKPPKRGGLVYSYVQKAIAKSLPTGVFSVVFGRGNEIVDPIMESGKVDVFAFIGSHMTANKISRKHPKPNRLKKVYGLDAKNVGIIMEDCDLDLTVNECLAGTLSYNGQRCTALKMLYVHKNIREKFLEKFTKAVDELQAGIPMDTPKITPVPDERVEFFKDLTKDALENGAKIINNPAKDNESFIAPKVLFPVNEKMRLFKEEQFGPLIPVVEFTNVFEPIKTIYESDFGQQCSIFGNESKDVGFLIDHLVSQVSRINLNSQCQRGPDILPFTGRKDSAVEVLSVSDALKAFSIPSLITAKITEDNKKLYTKMLEKEESSFLKKEYLF